MIPYCSITTLEIANIKKEWYKNEKKDLPDDLSWFNELSFAFLYMDNGSLAHSEDQNDRLNLTMSYLSKESCEKLSNKINEVFGNLDITVFYSKGWNIRINYKNGDALNSLWNKIYDLFPVCMQYKLPLKYRTGNQSRIEKIEFKSVLKLMEEKIISINYDISKDTQLINSKTGYTLKTETNNYFANGVLVHN
jgi:hypothetical protein